MSTTAEDRRWRHRLLGEFFVIVVGVLVALGVNALWSGRQDRGLEALYLEQILLDLRASRVELDAALEGYRKAIEQGGALTSAVGRASLPPADSLNAMLRESSNVPTFTPDLSTIDGGDLRLVPSPIVRNALLRYRGAVNNSKTVAQAQTPFLLRTFERIGKAISMAALIDPAVERHQSPNWERPADYPGFASDVV